MDTCIYIYICVCVCIRINKARDIDMVLEITLVTSLCHRARVLERPPIHELPPSGSEAGDVVGSPGNQLNTGSFVSRDVLITSGWYEH